jgi:hypothetical protein
MTHDELLNDIGICLESNYTKILTDALRAVVELHKPFTPEFGGGIDYCFRDDEPYPCKTIQAIERELSNG